MERMIAFVLGKNPQLSLAEIVSWFKTKEHDFSVVCMGKDFVIVTISKSIRVDASDFGGTLKIVEITDCITQEFVEEYFEKKELDFFMEVEEKMNIGFSYYGKQPDFDLRTVLKKKLRAEKIKGGVFGGDKPLEHVEILKRKLIGKEIILCENQGYFYIGTTSSIHDPYDFKKRDVERPEQRPILSISPRLARMLVNLSQTKKGVILDPFCGIGGVLQEAVLSGYDIRGVDLDSDIVRSCVKNLQWLETAYKKNVADVEKKIVSGDSRKLSGFFRRGEIQGIASEPHLGPILRRRPRKKAAKKILEALTKLYTPLFKECEKILEPGSHIAIVAPRFTTDKGDFSMDLEGISRSAGFRAIDPLADIGMHHDYPFVDFERRHKLMREIWIFEKK